MKTEFVFELREPMELPNPSEFGRFLCNSLAFTRNLTSVNVFTDGTPLLSLNKSLSSAHPARIPPSLDSSGNMSTMWSALTRSPQKLFSLKVCAFIPSALLRRYIGMTISFFFAQSLSYQLQEAFIRHITLRVQHFSKESSTESTLSLQLGTGRVEVSAGGLSTQMERVTKKKPPSSVDVHIIYNTADHAKPLSTYA